MAFRSALFRLVKPGSLVLSSLLSAGCVHGLGRPIASEGLPGTSGEELPRLPPPEAPRAPEPAALSHDDHGDQQGEDATPTLENASQGAPALRYAALDRATCEAELTKRGASFDRVDSARGVVAPIRLRGPLSGVTYRGLEPAAKRKTSPYEILDCRLALALDDLAKVLAKHDVVEVVHYSMYRPPPGKAPMAKPGRRHSGALAIDLGAMTTKDGRTLFVEKDFHGGIGQKPCGPKAPGNPSELRSVYCEIADAQLFNVMLSPDYNWAHRNHFHLEVTAGVRWLLVR